MAEDAGKLEVKYTVISDAAMRRLERLQKQFDKVGDAAEKQGKKVEKSYKKQVKAIAMFGAAATGMLYGIIRASSYASMWMDQVSHSMTRLTNKILEITGLKETIELFIGTLENLADELEDPEDNDFWARLADDFDNLSTKGKIATIVVAALGVAIGIVMALAFGGWVWKIVLAAAAFAGKIGLATIATKALALVIGGLKVVLAFLGSTVGIVAVVIAALVIGLAYLWSKTDIGIATIQSLINIWNNFKGDISDMGWLGAIEQALKDFGRLWLVAFVQNIKLIYEKFVEITGWIVKYAKEVGGKIITWLIDGIKGIMPALVNAFWYIYDNFWVILENVKTLAWNKALEIYQRLVDGFKAALQWVKDAFSKLTDIWNEEADVVVVAARHTGEDIVEEAAKGVDMAAPVLEASTTNVGERASDGLRDGVMGASDSVCDEMIDAVDCVATGVADINDVLDDITKNIAINVAIGTTTSLAAAAAMEAGEYVAGGFGWKLSGWSNTGGSSGGGGGGSSGGGGGYSASSWKLSGWMNSATGGHVNRTGAAVVHQGEDIVNLKRLLNGNPDSKRSQGDIIINPVINITSGGVNHNPFETNRVADVISKRMGEELRRITTNI